jgi:ubiquinone/menaquinone biosynthesis C-methylase UbiE
MRLVTKDDITEIYSKVHQRGLSYLLSKIAFSGIKRTESTFNHETIAAANWWQVPEVKERVRMKETGNPKIGYEDYVVQKYLIKKNKLRLLSLGSGVCSHELKFAAYDLFEEVKCVDLSQEPLRVAEKKAKELGLGNMIFQVSNVNESLLPSDHFDVVLFHSSLHHFKNVKELIGKQIYSTLKDDGLLIINDYTGPNRLIWSERQLSESNRLLLSEIPEKYRKRLKTNRLKRSISGPGLIRMILSDPSEAVDSDNILPAIYDCFDVLEEKEVGGNLLMLILKDIAHHFVDGGEETGQILRRLFDGEDEFIKEERSNQIFGVYRKKSEV